jgi:hypothetical protein
VIEVVEFRFAEEAFCEDGGAEALHQIGEDRSPAVAEWVDSGAGLDADVDESGLARSGSCTSTWPPGLPEGK